MSLVRRFVPVLVPVAVAFAASCDSPPTSDDPPDGGTQPSRLESLPRALTAGERAAVAASGDFSFALLRAVNARKAGQNVFISPLSASVALAMTAQGADGATDVAMRTTLGFPTSTAESMGESLRTLYALLLTLDRSVTLKSANAIWYRNTLAVQPSFVDATQRLFDARIGAANFDDAAGTVSQINGWAATQTNGKITKVLDTVARDQVMFLLNALYFKGAWRDRFDAARTQAQPFTASDGRSASVPLMQRTGAMGYARLDGYQAVDLPYGNGAFSMTVLLPDAGRSADALSASLDGAGWTRLVAALREGQVQLSLPRFTFSYSDQWKDVLTTLGMGVAFTDAADFSKMVRGGGVLIDFVKQDAYVDVTEEGTEAAAVTSVGISLTSAPVIPEVRVDRPFVFAIRERLTGAILFLGKIDRL